MDLNMRLNAPLPTKRYIISFLGLKVLETLTCKSPTWPQESLVELNKRLNVPLPMNRFRANIVLAGGEPWAEGRDWGPNPSSLLPKSPAPPQESLVDLNKRLNAPLPMNRFRANIVLAGGEPWAEDEWAGLRIGGLEFASVKPCGRCKASAALAHALQGCCGILPLMVMHHMLYSSRKACCGPCLTWSICGSLSHEHGISISQSFCNQQSGMLRLQSCISSLVSI